MIPSRFGLRAILLFVACFAVVHSLYQQFRSSSQSVVVRDLSQLTNEIDLQLNEAARSTNPTSVASTNLKKYGRVTRARLKIQCVSEGRKVSPIDVVCLVDNFLTIKDVPYAFDEVSSDRIYRWEYRLDDRSGEILLLMSIQDSKQEVNVFLNESN